MPANRFRSRSYKRVNTKTPGGVNVLKLAKSQKRPNRPFGGYLCPKCARKHFKDEARK